MPVREPDPHWDRVHRSLQNKIVYRERELFELHQDYIALQYRYAALMSVIRAQAARDRFEQANAEAKSG